MKKPTVKKPSSMKELAHELFAVTGRPVLHSRSPDLFRAGFGALGMRKQYLRLSAANASEAIRMAEQMNLSGMNVTSPLKQTMAQLVECSDDTSRALEAVNLIVFNSHVWCGYNTDPQGVVGALNQRGFEIRGSRALVLGAGGAGRAAVYGLVKAGAKVALANRTQSKARDWACRLDCSAVELSSLHDHVRSADLIVSCIPAGAWLIDPAWLNPGSIVLEADYSAGLLTRYAKDAGCDTIDGKQWLIHQAIAGFRIMLGRDVTYDDLRDALDSGLLSDRTNVILIGFMGSGKSSVGQKLAGKLGLEFVDTDELIQKRAGISIDEFFSTRGETAFREMEADTLGQVLEIKGRVVACGGGCVLSAQNREILRSSGVVVCLWAPLDVCMQRAADGARPLLKGPEAYIRAKALFSQRLSLYASCSHLVTASDGLNLEGIAGVLADEVRGIWKHHKG